MRGKAAILASAMAELVREHHDAFAVELFGSASGVSPERVQELLAKGLVDPRKLGGWTIPGLSHPLDYFGYMRLIGMLAERADPAQRQAMREWTMEQWAPAVDRLASTLWVQPPLPPSAEVGVATAPPPPPDPPGLSNAQLGSIRAARERAGSFARGLGNAYAQEIEDTLAEVWDGEEITEEVQPAVRQAQVEIVRERVADAVAASADPRQVARDLASDTGRWHHDWLRIAETELQGAYSDGIAIDALESYGAGAQVARIPEGGACDTCRGLLLDDEGRPRVFYVSELLAHGTNIGRPRKAWRPTIWPIHPRCRCDTVVVPPGMRVTAAGRLSRGEV